MSGAVGRLEAVATAITRDDLAGIRAGLEELIALLGEGDPPAGPEGLELLALNLMPPFVDPQTPADVAALLPEALASRGGELCAGVLGAIAALAPAPLSGMAARARDILAGAGIDSPHAADIGRLQPVECYRLELGGGQAEVLTALLQRPGDSCAQAAVLFVEHEECGGVISDAMLGGPEDPETVRALVARPHGQAGLASPVTAGEVARRMRATLAHMVDHEVELPMEALSGVLVLERALGSPSARWPRPFLGLSREMRRESEDRETRLRAEAEALAEEFAVDLDETAADPPLREHAPLTAHAMLEWRVGYGDGNLVRWSVGHLREFLLEWYPRKGDSEPEVLQAVCPGVVAFLRFLDATGRLVRGDVKALGAAVARLRPQFLRDAAEPRNWGPAKTMVMQMRAEGIDPADPEAVDAWIDAFNARPQARA